MTTKAARRVVLVIPNSRWGNKRYWKSYPYAALVLTALLREDFDFRVIDCNGRNLSVEELREELAGLSPRITLVTASSVEYQTQAHQALSAAKAAHPGTITVLGGVYPITLPEAAIEDPAVDWLFLYHAEGRVNAFLELLLAGRTEEAKAAPGIGYRDAGGLALTPLAERIGDVKEMVKPDYSQIDLAGYLMQEHLDYQFNSGRPTAFCLTSFGCPYRCVFCASRTISGRKVAYRPVAHILEEIEFLYERHGVRNIIFLDDALLADRRRINALLQALIDRKLDLTWKAATVAAWHLDEDLLRLMKASGCVQITISVESGSQRVLREVIHKPLRLEIVPPIIAQCRELGIDLGANFVIGLPGETWDEIRETFAFAERCDFDVTHFHIATPLPKTELYAISKEKGFLPPDFSFTDPKFFGFCSGFITTDEFTPMELAIVRAFEWDRINFSSPEKIRRVASIYNTTEAYLQEHRRQTRRHLGVYSDQVSRV